MANNNDELERMRRRLEELETENTRLRERQERQDLGRQVLVHLQRGGGNDRVLRALEAVQREYGEFEANFDLSRQRETISRVEELKEKLSSAMIHRNVSGAVGLAALGVQVVCYANPTARIAAGVVAMGSSAYSLYKRDDVEQIWRHIQNLLQSDAERFINLARAVEALDAVWNTQFGDSIHSENFRQLCIEANQARNAGVNANQLEIRNNDGQALAAIVENPKLQAVLAWFARCFNFRNVQTFMTSHYLYSILGIIALYVDDPIIERAIPGVFGACQLFVLVRDNISYREKLSAIDEGIRRMRRQSEGMEELADEG